jgi:hypothetical protein
MSSNGFIPTRTRKFSKSQIALAGRKRKSAKSGRFALASPGAFRDLLKFDLSIIEMELQ